MADRPQGFKPENAIPFKNLIPFDEIIADARGVGKSSVAVEREYRSLIAKFGTEFDIIMRAPKEDLLKGMPVRLAEGVLRVPALIFTLPSRTLNTPVRLAEGVLRVREGKVNIKAGFDGEYGQISVFDKETEKSAGEEQLSLF